MTAARRVSRICSGRRHAQTASPRFGSDERSQLCRSSDVPRSFEPNFVLACTEGCFRHAVFRETREEPFERPLPNLIIDRCSTVFLQDCVAVNPQDVVDTANSQTFPKEGELCLRILAKVDALVHGTGDVCPAQELVCDELPRPNRDSERDAAASQCSTQAVLLE